MSSQSTKHFLMIRPVSFCFNEETALDNTFQIPTLNSTEKNIQTKALEEFDSFVSKLLAAGVIVHVLPDTISPHTPDSIFPNNWISFHHNYTLILYPMRALNRRFERKPHIIEYIEKRFLVQTVIDLTRYEHHLQFLEGTGSIVLDHKAKNAFACISQRTDKELFEKFCKLMDYRPISFTALDSDGASIYHTNCIMCVADRYAILCVNCIPREEDQACVIQTLKRSGKILIPIDQKQMASFAGNMLQVRGSGDKNILVMSSQAFGSLTEEQVNMIKQFDDILHSDLSTIEKNGGGSARCMMAEIFLQERISC